MVRNHFRAGDGRVWMGLPFVLVVLALFAFLIAGRSAAASPARLVRDILPGQLGSNPNEFAEAAGKLFFSAGDGSYGFELWVSDGTAAGTLRLTDIAPGEASAFPRNLVNVQGTMFFIATNGTRDLQLWRSDGTRTGTRLVKQIEQGAGLMEVRELTAVANSLFFVVANLDVVTQVESSVLWRSDGSEPGTVVVAGLNASQLTEVDGTLFFVGEDPGDGPELWKSDGTRAGTAKVAGINPGTGGSHPQLLTNVGGTLFFVADNGSFEAGRELWKSDGTAAGTVQVKDINPGDASSHPTRLVAAGDMLFFVAYSPGRGRELWRSDGTTAGTVLVRDITPGDPGSTLQGLTSFDGELYFVVGSSPDSPYLAGWTLWRSDGTTAGTSVVAALSENFYFPTATAAPRGATSSQPIVEPQDPKPWTLISAGDGIFLSNGSALWRSDGTGRGTRMIQYLFGAELLPQDLGAAGAFVFFSHAEPLTGTELWAVPVAASVYARHEVFLPIMRDNRPTPTFEPYPFPNEPFPEQPPATAYVPVRP